MATYFENALRTRLMERRQKLETSIPTASDHAYLTCLLQEVDAALSRMEDGSYGLCDVCHEAIEADRLAADPLIRLCLDHLTEPQQRALEQDLQLATRIQSALLPLKGMEHAGWRTAYHYQPAGPVSGDYCDLITVDQDVLFFMLGDVSGKGVAASMLMAHLHAMLRALAGVRLPLSQMMEHASRVFCESTLADQYATLVCGRADSAGNMELCNAGHLPPLLCRGLEVRPIESTGLPMGLFCDEKFPVLRFQLNRGDRLLLYTDGLSETENPKGEEFGVQPIIEALETSRQLSTIDLVAECVAQAENFRSGLPLRDDLTLLALERCS